MVQIRNVTLASIVAVTSLLSMAAVGWGTVLSSADNRYLKKDEFKMFELKLFIRQSKFNLEMIERNLDTYYAKADTGIKLMAWEKRMYSRSLERKAQCEREINSLLKRVDKE